MGFLAKRRVNRAVDSLVSSGGGERGALTEALLTLREHPEEAIPRLLGALARSGPASASAAALRALLDDTTLPLYLPALSQPNSALARSVAEMLAQAEELQPERLVELYLDPALPKPLLSQVLAAHQSRLQPMQLLRLLPRLPEEARPAFFRLLEQVVDDASLADLLALLQSGDPGLQRNVVRVLRRFAQPAARDALLELLGAQHKQLRIAALDALAGFRLPLDPRPLCALLRDPDIDVQGHAVEALASRNDPGVVRQLLELLQDESQYVRRAAVEVLNRVGTPEAIKDLIGALEDSDWWVRVRAADALGQIGGSKVVDAVIALTGDPDTFVRRFAVEILNSNADPRARDSLVAALDDSDWWVRERAVDGLGALRDPTTLDPLLALLEQDTDAAPHVLRALARIGDRRALPAVEARLASADRATRVEAEQALAVLRGEKPPPPASQRRDLALSGARERHGSGSLEAPLRDGGRRSGASVTGAAASASTPAAAAPPPAAGYLDLDALAPGDLIDDRYKLQRRIGSGAFGEVLLVEDRVVHEPIILKFLHRHLTGDPEVISRFVQEMRVTRRITHENVIRIHDFLTFGRSFAIAMEYFDSSALGQRLRQAPPTRAQALGYLRAVCRGMAAAHAVGVVHRDLKPGNVLIDDAGLVKVVDFGLAAATGQMTTRMTRAGVVLGTPQYMAPEQIRGQAVDARTDIYSLGVMMYELFTGVPPYTGTEPMAIMFQHIEGKPVPPCERVPELPSGFEQVILRAMALNPEDRFQSMRDVEQALAALPPEGG